MSQTDVYLSAWKYTNCFFDEVKHSVFHWKNGYRGVINLSIQKKVLDYFYKYGNRYYVHYIEAGYPSGTFVAE